MTDGNSPRNNLNQLNDTVFSGVGLIGESSHMRQLHSDIKLAASSDHNVLISGETGTGKELCSLAIQRLSKRRNKPYVAVNCAAITESIFLSELFGHKKGSFTGATESHEGYLSTANKGTIFLDEIGELNVSLQAKLLRIIETGQFYPVGDSKIKKVNVRFIAATNINLEESVELKKFRADLYYRLNIFPIHMPPLRERTGDIPILVDYFVNRNMENYDKKIFGASNAVLRKMQDYSFPGNVRELMHMVDRAMVITQSSTLGIESFPALNTFATIDNREDKIKIDPYVGLSNSLAKVSKEAITSLLKENSGNVTHTAKALQIDRGTLYRKIRQHSIRLSEYRSNT